MYDTYPWENSYDETDLIYGDFLDPDKPFSMNLSDHDLMDISEKGYDNWLMGLAGLL